MENETAAQEKANSITEGVIWKNLLIYFFPILLGTFFQQMYNTVDAIIVGKYVGTVALAAVGTNTVILINLLVGFFTGVSSGATVILAQFYGARKNNDVHCTVHTAMALAIAMGAFLTVVGYVLSPTLLRAMNTPDDVLPLAVSYIRIYFLGMIPSLIYNIGSGLLRAVGDSRRPLLFLITACGINVVLDIALVIGADIGVEGAAIATILSQTCSAILVILSMMKTHDSYRLQLKKIRFYPSLLLSIVRIGMPTGFQSIMYSLSNTIIVSTLNTFGTKAMAAQTAYGKLDSMFWTIINAIGIAVSTFAGQNFGAGRLDRMRKTAKSGMCLAAIMTALVSTIIMLFGSYILRLFTDDPEVIEIGIIIYSCISPYYFTYIAVEVLSGTLRGAGDTLIPTILTLTGICVLRVIWVKTIAVKLNTIPGLMTCYPVSWGATSLLFIIYYYKGHWLNRCLNRAKAS